MSALLSGMGVRVTHLVEHHGMRGIPPISLAICSRQQIASNCRRLILVDTIGDRGRAGGQGGTGGGGAPG